MANPEVVDSPSRCFSQRVYPCSLRVTGGLLSFEKDSQKYQLADQSSLEILSVSKIKILQGSLWVKEARELQVQVSPVLTLKINGEVFMQKTSDTVLSVRNLSGQVGFESPHVFSNEFLPIGFENWYGPLDSQGQVSRGVIKPISMTDFLKVWIPVSGLSFAEMKRATKEYKELWREALDQSTSFYKEIVERRIASQEEKEREAQRMREAQQKEQAKLRKMFREKNGLIDSQDP